MAHVHALKDGGNTGPDQQTVSGDHIHILPDGSNTEPALDGPTHTHRIPGGERTPGGPIEIDDATAADMKLDL